MTPPADQGAQAEQEHSGAGRLLAGLRGRLGPASPLLTVSLAVLVAALACAAWFGWSWLSAANAAPSAYTQARDRALAEGEQAVQNFNTLDYRHVKQGIRLWLQSSAGALHSQVSSGEAVFEQQVRQAKTITTARVLDGALTALNTQSGKASLLVAVQITVTPQQGSPVIKRSRLQAKLTRTAAGWRLTEIGQVPVSGTAGH
jgi:Mce-associated membrane protein